MFDGSSWTNYLIITANQSITVDAQNNIWVGTQGNGVSVFNGTTWTIYTTANGLADNNVWAIAIDAQGNKWIGTTE